MKHKLAQILIFLLRKLNVSCIIGFDCYKDTIKARTNLAYYYDNSFNNMTVLDRNNDKLDIPDNAPFRIEVEIKK